MPAKEFELCSVPLIQMVHVPIPQSFEFAELRIFGCEAIAVVHFPRCLSIIQSEHRLIIFSEFVIVCDRLGYLNILLFKWKLKTEEACALLFDLVTIA